MSPWIGDELATVDLGDKRLNGRMGILLDRIGSQPERSIPAACRGWAETQAAYRFFDNPSVTPEKVLAPHRDATLERIRQQEVVLLVQDTTELDYTRPHERVQGGGPLNWEERIGFFNHTILAVTPERLSLGVVDATIWGRDPDDPNKNDRRKQVPIEEKESYRWIEGYRTTCAVAAQAPATTVVSVSDREGDIYELFVEAQPAGTQRKAEWIVRACQDRRLSERADAGGWCYQKLWETLAGCPVLGRVEVQIPKSEHRKARQATLAIQARRVRLKPPFRPGSKLPEVEVGVVRICEVDPPAGEEPIEWLLLTSLPVETFEAACRVFEFYLCRWQIEVYFRVLKSGCTVEELQLETDERLKPCLALYMIVAWRVLFVTMLGRACPDLSCTLLFADEEWQSVYTIVKRTAPPADAPRLGAFVAMVAQLGGHLGRKHDGPAGPKTLWIGLQRMTDFALAWQAFGPGTRKTCV